jgi:hypothetical protein
LTRNVCFIPLVFTVDSYVDKKCLLYLIVVYSWQLCWQEMLSTVNNNGIKQTFLVNITVNCKQQWNKADISCQHNSTVNNNGIKHMLTRNICFIPLLFTVDSYVDKKCLLYSIVAYSWVMLTRNICFIPLLFTVDSYVDNQFLLYSIVVYSWQLCW